MEQKAYTLPEYLDHLEGQALDLVMNIRTAKAAAKQQIADNAALEAKVKELEPKPSP